jgi:hypothetical protein
MQIHSQAWRQVVNLPEHIMMFGILLLQQLLIKRLL